MTPRHWKYLDQRLLSELKAERELAQNTLAQFGYSVFVWVDEFGHGGQGKAGEWITATGVNYTSISIPGTRWLLYAFSPCDSDISLQAKLMWGGQ